MSTTAARFTSALLVVAFLALVTAASWTCDDARITFRVVEQVIHGHGPRWNPDDRVLVSTHPAWLLLLSAVRAVVPWPTALVVRGVELVLTAAAAVLLVRGRPAGTTLVLAAALLGSKTLVEFATSGLEGALTSALLVGVGVALWRGAERVAAVLAGLLLLNRHDAVLLVGPLLLVGAVRSRSLTWLALPALVLVPWLLFATVWYGSPLPQPFVAKLQDDIPTLLRATRGLGWLHTSLTWDPGAALLLVVGLPLVAWRGDRAARALGLGAALGVVYAVFVGGDFMAGRFLHPPLWALLVALARVDLGLPTRRHLAVAGLLVLGAVAPRAPLWHLNAPPPETPTRDTTDERLFYAAGSRLSDLADPARNPTPLTEPGPPIDRTLAGLGGEEAGLFTHVIEHHGLTDPFLARLPPFCADARAGHCWRPEPPGYLETITTGRSHLADPDVTACWERVARVHRAPLTAPGRAAAAWALFTRGCDDLWRGRHLDREGRLVR